LESFKLGCCLGDRAPNADVGRKESLARGCSDLFSLPEIAVGLGCGSIRGGERKFPHFGRDILQIGRFFEGRKRSVDDKTASSLADLHSSNHRRQDNAYQYFMAATDEPIDWAYDVWADLLATLKTGDNRQRAIAAQVFCGLAKSDPELRMVKDLPALLAVTKDERFVTARHCMQSLWKIGVEGEKQRTALMKGLQVRFKECSTEKNCTLIRYDILESMLRIYRVVKEEAIRLTALALIETEPDSKYRKKYASLWRTG